jgi:predicted dehydrogenase
LAIGVGLIGTGNISEAYLRNARHFGMFEIRSCADINEAAAAAKAARWGIRAVPVDALLADPGIDLVLNLTTPQHHVPVGLRAIAAGKHVYAEKPLAVTLSEGLRLAEAAAAAGLRVGSAPDTFLGGSHQTARAALDAGAIGEVVAGTCHMMVPGHELWHPNPDFYYKAGGGPMLDMGPYYLTCLVNMLGPVRSVTGGAMRARATRTIGSGPRAGEEIAVEVDTHLSAILVFGNGAQVTITTSFDVWKHGHNHIELYGRNGSMIVPDPNRFDGTVRISAGSGDWQAVPMAHAYGDDNWRILGLADMADAILTGRPHRADLALALHVLEVMEAVQVSADAGRRIDLAHPAPRPAPLAPGLEVGRIG